MAVMEILFLGQLDVLADETYRGSKLSELFGRAEVEPHAQEKCTLDEHYGIACKDLNNAVDGSIMLLGNYTNNMDHDCILSNSLNDADDCKKLIPKQSSDPK